MAHFIMFYHLAVNSDKGDRSWRPHFDGNEGTPALSRMLDYCEVEGGAWGGGGTCNPAKQRLIGCLLTWAGGPIGL